MKNVLNILLEKNRAIYKIKSDETVSRIGTTVRDNWEGIARKCGLSRNACEYMRPAFEMCNSV